MRKAILPLVTVLAATIMGCETTTPNSPAQHVALQEQARTARQQFEAQDPTLQNLIDSSVGYAIFPEVGEAAVVVGGASGKGDVYRSGHLVGHVTVGEGSIGAQVGGDTYAELIIFRDEAALNRLMNNSFEFGADATATLVKAGAAGTTSFSGGSQVFILPKGGLKVGVALKGQKFHFTPAQEQETTTQIRQ